MTSNTLWNEILKRMAETNVVEPSDLHDLYSEPLKKNVTQEILFNRRIYFIRKVKAPLVNAVIKLFKSHWWSKFFVLLDILKLIKKYPDVNRENTSDNATLVFLDIIDKFNKYHNNNYRQSLFDYTFRLIKPELAHDLYYNSIALWFLEEAIKAILDGKLQPRPEGWLKKTWWKEPEPYGGKHSIIHKMREHRKAILKILES